MIISKRKVLRYSELTNEEVSDMFISTKQIIPVLERHFGCTSVTLIMQGIETFYWIKIGLKTTFKRWKRSRTISKTLSFASDAKERRRCWKYLS